MTISMIIYTQIVHDCKDISNRASPYGNKSHAILGFDGKRMHTNTNTESDYIEFRTAISRLQ